MTNHFYEAFGPHLVVDSYGGNGDSLRDPEVIRKFLEVIPEQIHMTPISPVVVMPNADGLSGFVIIAESHIVVHTWPLKLLAQLDIFSCKEFNMEKAKSLFKEFFGPFRRMLSQTMDRGTEFPRNVKKVEKYLKQKRAEIS